MTGTHTKFAQLAASAAFASLTLAGCAMGGGNDRPSSYAAKPLPAQGGKAVAKAEAAVLANPRDAATRAALGAAYLNAGRFASAAEAYNDALNLGDEAVATVLGLALADTAMGNRDAALELLRDFRDVVPAGDLGLAYALAGDTQRGVDILAQAMRDGDASAKTRQNLAYALSLNGQWADAKLMVAQDVPADQVNPRLVEWARMGRPDAVVQRVAHLLGVTPVADSGQPQALALANFPGTDQLAAEAQAQAASQVADAPVAPEPAAAPAPLEQAAVELPPVAAPAAPPVTFAALEQPSANVASDAPAFVSIPTPATRAPVKPRVVGKAVSKFSPQVRDAVQPGQGKGLAAIGFKPLASGGSHWLQLGSFTNPAVAKDGWGKFTRRTPALKGYKTVTTTAVVNGTPVWRVAATGFVSYSAAKAMCDRVKARGGACLVKRAELSGARLGALSK